MFTQTINNTQFTFETSSNVFSPSKIDSGTLAMLSAVDFSAGDKLLDLGCGYGAVGIYAAQFLEPQNIVMCDIDDECIRLTKKNLELNGIKGVEVVTGSGFSNIGCNDFTLILSNPPYHSDFSIPKHFIEKGFNRLQIAGKMYMVTKREAWYRNKLTAIFGGVRVQEIDGYFVFCAEKRSHQYHSKRNNRRS